MFFIGKLNTFTLHFLTFKFPQICFGKRFPTHFKLTQVPTFRMCLLLLLFFQKSFMFLTPPVLSWSFSLTFALSLSCSLSSGGFEHQIIQQSVFLCGRFRKQKCAKIIRTMYRVTYRAALKIQKRIKGLRFSFGGGEDSSHKDFHFSSGSLPVRDAF